MFNKLRTVQLQQGNDNLGAGLRTPWFIRQQIPRQGLVWEWLLNWNAEDSSGYGNNGTATNVTYTDTSVGYTKQNGVFNWSNSYISCPLPVASWSITVASIINHITTSWSRAIVASWWASSAPQWVLTINTNNPIFSVKNTSNNWPDATPSATISAWYHTIIGSWDWTTNTGWVKIYVDWKLAGTATFSWTEKENSNGLRIWNNWVGSNVDYYNWWIQCVRLFNRELSQKEIYMLHLELIKLLH